MLDWVGAARRCSDGIAAECEPLDKALAAELGTFMTPVVPAPYAMPILAGWAAGTIDLYKLGLNEQQIAMAYGADGWELTGSIRAESADGRPWDSDANFFGEGVDQHYEGGGWIVSSSGEEYPIMFPTVVTEDGTYTADSGPTLPGDPSVSNLGGDDDGWHVVEIQSGVERFYPDLTFWEAAAVGAAGTTGLVGPLPPDSGLDFIVAPTGGGPPFFTSMPASLPQITDVEWSPSSDDPLSYPAPDQVGPYLPDLPPGLRPLGPATAPVWLNVADLAPTIAGAAIAISGINNGTDQAYQVVFEENDDGRRRASVTTYTLSYDENDEVRINAYHLAVGPEGDLALQTISYGDPYSTVMPSLPGSWPVAPSQFHGVDWDPIRMGDTTVL